MSINIANLKASLLRVNETLNSSEIVKISSKKEITPKNVDKIIDILCDNLYENPHVTNLIRDNFGIFLLPIVSKFLDLPKKNFADYQIKCFVLSILAENNVQVKRYSFEFFNEESRSPFQEEVYIKECITKHKRKKMKISNDSVLTDLDIIIMCSRFLKIDLMYFRRIWDWNYFIERFHNEGCELQKFYYNQIVSMIFCMNINQTSVLNSRTSDETVVKTEIVEDICEITYETNDMKEEMIDWKFESEKLIDIEGVYLPTFDKSVMKYYQNRLDIVRVNSTKVNLRSLALGISSGKAICLNGSVGSGKTTLVEYMAKKVGRFSPNIDEYRKFIESKNQLETRSMNGNGKRKLENDSFREIDVHSGFLRIQLGDQTDSKLLLGQYRCSDIPGEFIWQPGILTKAVMNGYWLLLEDVDSATQDVCAILTNLLENNFLCVPGFRENLKIAHGFQLFMTLRTQKNSTKSSNSAYALLEKHLYTINMLPLSKTELITVICQNYPNLTTVASRIVDVFLIFSRGGHENLIDDYDLNSTFEMKDLSQYDDVPLYAGKISNLPNSGRMVSTRDLLKLCKRSCQTFQSTSIECAYLVFQNCVDLFCSHIPAGDLKTNLIISIGARLGIIESRCVHLANEYKPKPDITSEEFSIGRAKIRIGFSTYGKKFKTNESNEDNVQISDYKQAPPTFSFTRISSCILERIAVAVQQNEPVLLVGETGTGKTSSVQYLAYKTNHRLVVVNMNNQSDVSDLIGGYKPVDVSFIISPLRNEFELLFTRTFDTIKNEKFLGHVSGCFNRGDFPILVKLMLKVIPNACKLAMDRKNSNDLTRWEMLEKKLKKFEQQLKTSSNLAFAFIPGSLVNCIRNGDWVLLDEINLASTETLECLSTILEPDGSIILLERGDFVPIKRHPNFRIFACMNPSTDVGKKDLPIGIRNRFSEYFVDELTNENDLQTLIGDYLKNTGIDKSRIHEAVLLYMSLRNLSQLELNDGLGNKPVFSLRTLCRALKTCSKNLCGSIERNIYESFCLSFLTQLDPESHMKVLKKIQQHLISDVKRVLSQSIPKPKGDVTNFEGYWIENGTKEKQECKEYIITESVQKNLKDLARIISIGKLPILLQGPTSAGKTSLIEFIAKRTGNHCLRINNHEHTDLQEYVGTYVADITGKLSFQEGVLVKAMRNGFWIILDELNLAPSDILEALNRVLDDNRELYIPETQTVVKAHPNFMLFATQNPPGLYGGRKTLSRAFKNRFIELHFSEIPKNELEVILEKRCLIPMKYAKKMVQTMSSLQVNRRTTNKKNFTLRDLFRWGNRYTFAENSLLEDRNYDWNQHLVDEGYLVLSAKVRNEVETEIIIETLFKNFSKKISVENLFSLNSNTSMVTRRILEQLFNYVGSQKIVWTYGMRRMAVLVSKSLQFNEPVLLVGLTGCGKTTICQLLAELTGKSLNILNCHMHTESADFLGGLRPCRNSNDFSEKSAQLFKWYDGPLVYSMREGNFFLADEISLAEDSVLERLNCVLETERTLLLAEKCGTNEQIENSEFIVKAVDGFQFLATMNPGGDFGKKELSPALRNRFTEIWCSSAYSNEDLTNITVNSLQLAYNMTHPDIDKIAKVIVRTISVLKTNIEKLNFSIRDVLAWTNYITKNFDIANSQSKLSLDKALFYGLHTIFLDALEMLPYENFDQVISIRASIISEMKNFMCQIFNKCEDFPILIDLNEKDVKIDSKFFGIHPFFLDVNQVNSSISNSYSFSAPTTKKNLFRILSALSIKKAILLEGPPGVGKSSLIENIASTIGYNLVRINLCEHTDIADLFGTDLPAESSIFESDESDLQLGSFVWRDGPLLAALKAPKTWILLDELNLAPQSVLEGLNAILDHRGEVYIPELNKTFQLAEDTRIFATQNPLRQGGGRKGLPQSFLNRFTKVYLQKLQKDDLLQVVHYNFGFIENCKVLKNLRLIEKMVIFSERVENGIANMEFGYKGGPFEANLRDMLRWCEFLTSEKTGFNMKTLDQNDSEKSKNDFLLVLFEKMKLVYCQRMRTHADIEHIVNIFGQVFDCNPLELNKRSSTVGFYWNDSNVFFDDIELKRQEVNEDSIVDFSRKDRTILLDSQMGNLKNLTECVMQNKPVIFCAPNDCGKTKIINAFCEIFNRKLYLDNIDDSVTGSFQQLDFNRILEDLWQKVQEIIFEKLRQSALNEQNKKFQHSNLLKQWREYDLKISQFDLNGNDQKSQLDNFYCRLDILESILLTLQPFCSEKVHDIRKMMSDVVSWRNILKKSFTKLSIGGHFEWIDSVIVKSIKFGHFLCLEHINLVSSAILDRLNPVIETNGTLMISEKGVDQNNLPEIISKHPNFQIFLTMDPKYGEISRAMRNRCIELSISNQNYSENDLRKLIYLQGVHEMYLIKSIILIHNNLCKLSDYTNFGVSHAIKMAFLVAQNRRMGVTYKKCLTLSALEVYVRSSQLDMLGFGLEYYKNKLKECIFDVIEQTNPCPNFVNLRNIILYSNELSSINMIKLQSESLFALLSSKNSNISDVLNSLNTKFDKLQNISVTPKYLLTFLYMISSFSDVKKRKIYLHEKISKMNEPHLLHLNEQFYKIVSQFKSKKQSNLPWNASMFRRLRPYDEEKLEQSHVYIIILSLALELTINEVTTKKSFDLKTIDAITYSKGIQEKAVIDTIDNKLITELHNLMRSFKTYAASILKETNFELNGETFITLLLSYLWFNRILQVSMTRLFEYNNITHDLLDELYLHFKWFNKNCIVHLSRLSETNSNHHFEKLFNEIQSFLLSHHHPLEVFKKLYVVEYTSFHPFCSESQLERFKNVNNLQKIIYIMPKMNEFGNFQDYQKRFTLIMSKKYGDFKRELYTNCNSYVNDALSNFNRIFNNEANDLETNNLWTNHYQSYKIEDGFIENFTDYVSKFEDFIQMDISINFSSNQYSIEMLPVLEYFFIKALPLATNSLCKINEEFILNIPSMDIKSILLLKILNDSRYELLQRFSNYDQSFCKEFAKLHSTFKMKIQHDVQKVIHESLLINSQLCRSYDNEELYTECLNSMYLNGPLLTLNILSFLIDKKGKLRETGIGEVKQWIQSLNTLNNLLWINSKINGEKFDMLSNALLNNERNASQLLDNIEAIKDKCSSMVNENHSDFNKDFWNVVENLNYIMSVKNSWMKNYVIETFCGIIQLNLLSYFPLIDPVKKNRLKSKYVQEDICHLNQLLLSYKFMSIMLNYDDLGLEDRRLLQSEIDILSEKLTKKSRKVAIRPDMCQYSAMVKNINHFLSVCCQPKQLLEIISKTTNLLDKIKQISKTHHKNQINELISKINLWIINADKFTNHTMSNYKAYYQDFTSPIECSLTLLKNGLIGLKSLLVMKHDSIDLSERYDADFEIFMRELIEFPIKPKICININAFPIANNSNTENEIIFLELIKSQILQIKNESKTLHGKIDADTFNRFDSVLNLCNQLWQKQEESKRRKQIEEDCLYVTKTKCIEKTEENLQDEEVADMFPENTNNDFNEFLQQDTLEKIKIQNDLKQDVDIIGDEEYKFIVEFFILMMNGTNLNSKDYIGVFEHKLKVFYKLFDQYKNCLDCSLDNALYKSLSLTVALTQEKFNEVQIRDFPAKAYNFYKDSNISEALTCIEIMTKLENRVLIELEKWPDHAVLNDIIIIIKRIRGFSSSSPLVRFNVGMQILRKKVDEWNSVAHRLNNFKDIESELANIIQRWMKMELQCWRESLHQTFEKVSCKAYRYWFFLYNTIHEFLVNVQTENEVKDTQPFSDLINFENGHTNLNIDEQKSQILSFDAIKKVIKQFIESSCYAEFSVRMNLLQSFKFYLIWFNNKEKSENVKDLIALLHNIHEYFSQFSAQIQEYIDFVRKPIEDKLRKFVKINSFNKDLSYFSTEANIKQVHRNLNKYLKEYEVEITKKISALFTYREPGIELDSNHYIESYNFHVECDSFVIADYEKNIEKIKSINILSNINKYIQKTRNIVKKSLSQISYTELINETNEFVNDQLNTCSYLRALKVDDKLPRSKQKSQAKSILNQKRKALTDFFKSMTSLIGINYKTGLLNITLKSELLDLKIQPFEICKLEFSENHIEKAVDVANQKLELYYNKSIFKIKLLMNLLLQPHRDMDYSFLERVKGFAIDLFILIQNERKILGETVNLLNKLKNQIRDLNMIQSQNKIVSYECEFKKFVVMKYSFTYAAEILEQFKILLNCAPDNDDTQNLKILTSDNNVLFKQSTTFIKMSQKTNELLTILNKICASIVSYETNFVNENDTFISQMKQIISHLGEFRELFLFDNEYLTFGSPICDLYDHMTEQYKKIQTYEKEETQKQISVSDELEKLSNSILLAIQNLYKRHCNNDEVKNIKENDQLKEKLYKSLSNDISILKLKEVTMMISKILNSVFISIDIDTRNLLVSIHPLIQQYKLLVDYFVVQQIRAHKSLVKMLSIMLSVFLELVKNGFCVPENLLTDEEQKQEGDSKTGEGFGFEDGEGEKDISDKLESEDQLDEARKPEDYKKDEEQEKECKEEKGIDMSENFEGKMHDVENEDSDAENSNDEENEEMDKEMGETKEGADKLDDQIWGSDDENEKEDDKDENKDETGKGSGEKDDKHNDLDAEMDGGVQQKQEEGLDAAAERGENQKKSQQKNDIDYMNEQEEGDEDQNNPYHNQFDEPPEPEDFNLDYEFNLDKNDKEEREDENEENPFDIDSMKDKMDVKDDPTEIDEDDAEPQTKEENETNSSEGEDENSDENLNDAPEESQNIDESKEEEESSQIQHDKENNPDEKDNSNENDEKHKELPNDYQESKDNQSKEENIQSMPNQNDKGSRDQVQAETCEEMTKQEAEIDDQDTGEDKDGVGQAENQESKSGHQGVSDTKESRSRKNQDREEMQKNRKKGNTDEERTLGEVDDMKNKFLKTVERLNRDQKDENNVETNENQESDEYQHVKDAKKNDKSTFDNATEEQSREVQHKDDVNVSNEKEEESHEELMDVEDSKPEPEIIDKDEMRSRKFEDKSNQPSKSDDNLKTILENTEEIKIDGEDVATFSVPRGDETTAHYQMDIINDKTLCEEISHNESLEIRKMVDSEMKSQKVFNPKADDMEKWQELSNQMMSNARELCEQLRLILEPTKCTRLKGDYRTGRRINMKKIIPYIASQFRKDKIWLRRTKAAQRDYKITIAVDDSKSMDHNNSKELTLQTISLVSQALTLLETGKLCVVSFGESSKVLLKYTEQFNGPNLIKSLNFDQNKTRIAELLDFTRVMNEEDSSSDSSLFEHLLIILSDGRNIYAEGEQRVRNAIKMARLQRMFLIYIIIDNPNNKNSILDIQSVQSTPEKGIKIVSYMDQFPFPYYVIVRDLNQLPQVLSEGLRQWFELVNSEQ